MILQGPRLKELALPCVPDQGSVFSDAFLVCSDRLPNFPHSFFVIPSKTPHTFPTIHCLSFWFTPLIISSLYFFWGVALFCCETGPFRDSTFIFEALSRSYKYYTTNWLVAEPGHQEAGLDLEIMMLLGIATASSWFPPDLHRRLATWHREMAAGQELEALKYDARKAADRSLRLEESLQVVDEELKKTRVANKEQLEDLKTQVAESRSFNTTLKNRLDAAQTALRVAMDAVNPNLPLKQRDVSDLKSSATSARTYAA